MKLRKQNITNILIVIAFIVGLFLLLYPSISDYWNSFTQSKAIASYTEEVAQIDNELYKEMLIEAQEYNANLFYNSNPYLLEDKQEEQYYELLNLGDTGVMGYIEIPDINCSLPIYHGTAEAVLQVAIGHLEWTSLPIGGESTHCVVSGHRGLPSAKLFTDLDKLSEGDVFILRVLDEVLTYEVDRILIVEPHEVEALQIVEGEDYCTLVTCTPYGINTHRLLVRGHRVENLEESKMIRVTADAVPIEPIIVASFVAIPLLLALLIVLMVSDRKKKNRKKVRSYIGGDKGAED